MNHPPFPASSS